MRAAARLAAVVLVASLLAGPVLLDACLLTCEGAQDGAASSPVPACHHTDAPAGVHLKAAVRPCAHDHHAVTATSSVPDQSVRAAHVARDAGVAARDSNLVVPGRSFARDVSVTHSPPDDQHHAMLMSLRI